MKNKSDIQISEAKPTTYLAGKLLLAMPGMGDPRFEKAVIFMCHHDENGAMGLMVNKTLANINLDQMLEELGIVSEISSTLRPDEVPVMNGGPVETGRGFLLHSSDFSYPETVNIGDGYALTGTMDMLKKTVSGEGPNSVLFILGYAGWDSGQLDQELQQNAWLIADIPSGLMFDTPPEDKWEKALSHMGIEPGFLSMQAGSA